MSNNTVGIVLATAAAGLLAIAPVSMAATSTTSQAHCYGVNACKGKGACKTSYNACKGQNSCKGKGFLLMTQTQCAKQGGSLTEPKE
ncbi:MAG: hypothetical protein HKM04_09740 [Legionellales bacterium]|nr:hypothetical protein [Legionellales bacterium]